MEPPLDETIWADADSLITGWEDEGGATSNLYQSVDSDSDADYVNRVTPIINSTVSLRFRLADIVGPPDEPLSDQVVYLEVKFEYIQVDQPLDSAPTASLYIREGTSTNRASNTGITVTQTPTDQSVTMTTGEINSVTDWTNLYAHMTFTTSGNGVDQDVDYRIYRVRMHFSP